MIYEHQNIGCEHYCYYCYALNKAETDWRKEILIYKDIKTRLNRELTMTTPQKIYMGWQTDPYQPCEADYIQTRQILELLLDKKFSASILTKSDLVVRDIDILKEMDNASVSISVAFTDNQIRRQFEANTIDTGNRIKALRKLHESGIKTSAMICPVIPYITDVKMLIDMLTPYAEVIWIYGLSVQEGSEQSWQNVKSILDSHFPDEKQKIESVIRDREHLYWEQLRGNLYGLQKEKNINLNIHL
jgi:DNA repair photolyase